MFYLPTSVRVPQHIILSKVPMGRHDHNIENHWDPPEELLESAWIGSLQEVEQKLDHFQNTLSSVTPASFKPNLLELMLELGVWCIWLEGGQVLLGLP